MESLELMQQRLAKHQVSLLKPKKKYKVGVHYLDDSGVELQKIRQRVSTTVGQGVGFKNNFSYGHQS